MDSTGPVPPDGEAIPPGPIPRPKEKPSVYDKILAHLKQHPGTVYEAGAVAEFLNLPKPNVAEALNRMVRAGLGGINPGTVERPELGKFVYKHAAEP